MACTRSGVAMAMLPVKLSSLFRLRTGGPMGVLTERARLGRLSGLAKGGES